MYLQQSLALNTTYFLPNMKKSLSLAFLICGCGVMAAAPDLGSGASRRGGSSPFIRTLLKPASCGFFYTQKKGREFYAELSEASPFIRTAKSPSNIGLLVFLRKCLWLKALVTAQVSQIYQKAVAGVISPRMCHLNNTLIGCYLFVVF